MMEDKRTNEKLAASLTARSTDLLPFLAYLLQDLWRLGGDPGATLALLQKHLPNPAGGRVLDLACGKGAVSIPLAKELGVAVKGVDLLCAFVEEANEKAREHGVAGRCVYEQRDVNEAVADERGYDLVIFSAAGDILGPPQEALPKLAATVKPGGYVLLDESYLAAAPGAIRYGSGEGYITEEEWLRLFRVNHLTEVARMLHDDNEAEAAHNAQDLAHIARRVEELKQRYPDRAPLFDDYLQSQQDEVYDVEHNLVNLLWLLRKEG